jgi:hypothetical protein
VTGRRKIAVAAAVVVLAGIAIGVRKAYVKADRLALAAEIERELAARPVPVRPPAPPVPEAEDAAPLWKAALGAMDESVIGDIYVALEEREWKEVPETVRRAEEANAKAFSLADEAASRSRCSPMPAGPSPWYPMNQLGTLLGARFRSALHRKEGTGAMACVRTLRALGRDMPRFPATQELAWMCPAMAHNRQADALELLAQIAGTPALGQQEAALALAVEPWALRADWDESRALLREAIDRDFVSILTMSPEEWAKSIGLPVPTYGERLERLVKSGKPFGYLQHPSADGIRGIRPHLDRLTAAGRRRDVQSLVPGGPLDEELHSEVEIEAAKFASLLCPRNARVAIVVEAQAEVVRAALALQVFEKRNGRPAASWDDVVPAILPSIPLDPGDGKPIRFLVRPGGGAAWSVLSEGKWEETREAEDRPRPRIEWGPPK